LARATHALIDPSCSGSGLVTRDAGLNLEHDTNGAIDALALTSWRAFNTKCS
jgi:16S rRNA C967 or C1407 C5-methylase (RsmB/RsmF family)